MTLPVFSDAWAMACSLVLNQNSAYRKAAATWEGALLLHMAPPPGGAEERCVFLDLWHGECRAARAAAPGDEAEARYILSGSTSSWRLVLTGRVAPLVAIMTGKLTLTKGSLADLIPYVTAAKELVITAASVEAAFPDEA